MSLSSGIYPGKMQLSLLVSGLFALASASPLGRHPDGREATETGHESLVPQGNDKAAFTLHQMANERYVEESGLDALLRNG